MSDNEENDLFADDDDQERPPMLPALSPLRGGEDPHVGLVGAADQAKENEDLPKPRTRRPVPLLNDDRLTDKKRGLAYLVKEFPSIKFKGKGHEASDIRCLMRSYEHWANRLFPKYPFDKFIRTLEGPLTSKAGVKACMNRLRHGEFEEDEVNSGDDDGNNVLNQNTRPSVDQMADFGGEVRTADPPPPDHMAMARPSPAQVTHPPPPSTNDSLERIRFNREQAMARLAARRAAQQANGQGNDRQETGRSHHDQEDMDPEIVDSEKGNENVDKQTVNATEDDDSGLAEMETEDI